LYRYRVPPEEEGEEEEEGVTYSLPAEGKWRTPTGRGRAVGYLRRPTCRQEGQCG
jgi:hypothetical protein